MPTLIFSFKRVRSLFSEELLLSASVLFLPVLYMTAALALLSGVGLGRWVFPTGLLLWGIAVVALHGRERWQRLVITLLLLLAAFALAAWVLSFPVDGYYDSRTYHAQAVLELLKGVNPYLQPDHWVTLPYPAAHWLLSASFVLWTQSFEASFAFTPYCRCCDVFLREAFSRNLAAAFSCLAQCFGVSARLQSHRNMEFLHPP